MKLLKGIVLGFAIIFSMHILFVFTEIFRFVYTDKTWIIWTDAKKIISLFCLSIAMFSWIAFIEILRRDERKKKG